MSNQWKLRRLNALRDFAKSSQLDVPDNKIWRGINDELGIGSVRGKRIIFNHQGKRLLLKKASAIYGTDIIDSVNPETRLNAAEVFSNEKLAMQKVFERYTLAAHATGELIKSQGGTSIAAPGTSAMVEPELLRIDQDQWLVIVENGSLINAWQELLLPQSMRHSLLVYRGHSRSALGVKQLTQQHHQRAVLFPDFDIEGLMMALSSGVSHILVPQAWQSDSYLKPLNRKDMAIKQLANHSASQRARLFNSTLGEMADKLITLELAIPQEKLLGEPLIRVPTTTR